MLNDQELTQFFYLEKKLTFFIMLKIQNLLYVIGRTLYNCFFLLANKYMLIDVKQTIQYTDIHKTLMNISLLHINYFTITSITKTLEILT